MKSHTDDAFARYLAKTTDVEAARLVDRLRRVGVRTFVVHLASGDLTPVCTHGYSVGPTGALSFYLLDAGGAPITKRTFPAETWRRVVDVTPPDQLDAIRAVMADAKAWRDQYTQIGASMRVSASQSTTVH